jgi:hypothetical protein
MWGAINQPSSYVSGYGFTPSSMVSAHYVAASGGTPTLTGITLSLVGNSLTVGTSAQVVATCSYSNSTTTNCDTTDAFGNVASSWTSSVPADASISTSGTLTALAAGSTNVQAHAGSFTSNSLTVTINAAAPTLTGVTISDGGVGTLSVGQTVQASATAQYNNGAITTNCTSTADSHGTICGTWTSSTPADATVSTSGLITAVATGSTGVTVKATNGGTSFTSVSLPLTITSATPPSGTLSGVTIGCASGSTSVPVGNTLACSATCTYNLTGGGTTTTNCTTTDAFGTTANTWASSVTADATVNSTTGLVTGVAVGSTNLTVHAGSFTSPAFSVKVTAATTSGVLGNNQFDSSGDTFAGSEVATYAVSPPTASSVSFFNLYLPTGFTYPAGSLYDVILVLAPTSTTQSSTALCSGTYVATGTSSDVGWHQFGPNGSGCGTLPASTAYWIGTVTNQGGPIGLGFWDCNGGSAGCNGSAPTSGNGTYPFYFVSVNYGTYTGMPTAMIASTAPGGTGLQASLFATLSTPNPTLTGGFQTNVGNVNTLTVGGTVQMQAFCNYSNGQSLQCFPTPDAFGNTVTSWSSSNTGIITDGGVGSTHPGLVTAIGAGTANSLATFTGGVASNVWTFTITSGSGNAPPGNGGGKRHR